MGKVIITGANGFVGTALCEELIKRGDTVYAIVREDAVIPDSFKHNDNIIIVQCSMANYDKLSIMLKEKNFDILYHFAWVGSAGELRGDYEVQLNNVKCACEIVKICNELSCKRIVFSASIMEYEIQALMDTEKVPGISSLYSTAKLTADYMMRAIANREKIEYIRAIISNIYGPGENSPRLINTSLRKMLHNEHCAFSEGNQIYDFIYITDAAKMFAEIGRKGFPNKTYYIGSLNPRPLKDFLLKMQDAAAPLQEIGLGELSFDGVSLSYEEFDVESVKKDTGFSPEISFDEGIRRTIEWIKKEE